MISEALIIKDDKVLMVQQYVERGDIVWNFPGGSIEDGETPEEACIREVKEETGYDVIILKLLNCTDDKYTYLARINGGEMFLDSENEANKDIIEIAWVSVNDTNKWDDYTSPILNIYQKITT
ncbi:NUDIX hydrolase [Paenibacillus sp. GCM10023248]|uniref:NUDIX hydrolase n=1 Tax=unclassified Paenibacillus TaxID=185978 RepID=UPI00237807F3|nr:NUDIX hydrolase [Paenibacillus sp. MAHUQ-63]MDD9268189.1 NUDIX hydrolase [Paenibacillus sp. MAHUQ-63]